jgi:Rod binding domain-containing protein
MSGIKGIGAMPAGAHKVGTVHKGAADKTDAALKKVAAEFESALVRQLLQSAKVGGKQADKGYGSMAVDALASGLSAGGGLGLARAIEAALAHAQMTPKK